MMIEIHVNGEKTLYCNKGENLFDVLAKNGITFIGNCGRLGRCNACMVYDEENSCFIKSCKHEITKDMNISLSEKKSKITDHYININPMAGKASKSEKVSDDCCGIAIDVGTTTIAMELIDLKRNEVMERYSAYNSQICYGADVISRIRYGISPDGLHQLRKLVLSDIYTGISHMTGQHAVPIARIVIAGNTTMLSIIEGDTLENLAAYPFLIKNRYAKTYLFSELLEETVSGQKDISCYEALKNTVVTCLPNISAFVGSDVASGAYAMGIGNENSYNMLIDLGTNGEIIIANNKRGFATSCACGPAFEGCFRSGSMQGTTLFDMIAILRKRNMIDDTGLLKEPYFEKGYRAGRDIVIDMELIHHFLLAKAAISAGIDTIVRECGIDYQDIEQVNISGGFGFHLNIENAIYLGMFPDAFRHKAVIAGNTSLKGAGYCLQDKNNIKYLDDFIETITPVNMGEHQTFHDSYIKSICFPN